MKNQEKSNPVPLKDYKELSHSYNTLEALYEKERDDRKMLESVLNFMAELNWSRPGGDFFTSLAKYLGETLSVDYVFVNRVKDGITATSLANFRLGEICPNFTYSLKDTPCINIYNKELCSYPSNIQQEFPNDNALLAMCAESYCGIPLWDSGGNPIGLIALIHRHPLQNIEKTEAILKMVAAHTAQEIERIDAENILRTSEKRFKQVAESAGVWIWEVDANGLYTYSSPVVEKILGYTPKEIVGKKHFYDFFYSENVEELKDKVLRYFESKQPLVELLNLNVHKNGSLAWLSTTGSPILDNDGNLLGYQGVDTNVTDRKLAEEALKESAFFFKESQKAASIGSYKSDFIKGVWESSEVLDHIFGIDKDYKRDIPGWLSIVHPADKEMMNRYLAEEIIQKQNPFNKEYRILRKNDNQTRWVLGLGTANFDDNGNVLLLVGTIQDITERRLDEEKIRKLNSAVKATSEVVFMTDREGVFTYINPAFTAVYGHEEKDVIGKVTPRILKSGVMDPSKYEYFWNELLNNREIVGELINKTRDGRNIYVEGSANAIVNDEGEIIGFIAIQKDITVRKQIEEELVMAKEKAEESGRLKSAFLANMSHEIRTPMNGIIGFAELLKAPSLTNDEIQDYIRTIQISGERMLNTINSIIDVSQIESGMINIDISEVNVNEKIKSIYRFFKPECDKKGLILSFKASLSSLEATINTDKEKVYGVMTNLIKNAVKFTDTGSIEFGYEKKGKHLEFFVKDTGMGLHPDQNEVIFERFRQGSDSYNRGYEGNGLGLSICKSYVDMLGGKIWVESARGKGSTFFFTIPYSPVSGEGADKTDARSSAQKNFQSDNLKILIVEDDEISFSLLSKYLQKSNTEILRSKTGIEAINACKENRDIDLILMDIKMPEMNGYEATRQIRQFNKEIVIFAQTAFGLKGDEEEAKKAGCNEYISKPVNKEQLLGLFQKYFNT